MKIIDLYKYLDNFDLTIIFKNIKFDDFLCYKLNQYLGTISNFNSNFTELKENLK
jgi:hypothetical protein